MWSGLAQTLTARRRVIPEMLEDSRLGFAPADEAPPVKTANIRDVWQAEELASSPLTDLGYDPAGTVFKQRLVRVLRVGDAPPAQKWSDLVHGEHFATRRQRESMRVKDPDATVGETLPCFVFFGGYRCTHGGLD